MIATLFNTLQFVIIGSGNVTPPCPHQMFPRKMFSNEMYTTEALTNETYINEMSTRKTFSPPRKLVDNLASLSLLRMRRANQPLNKKTSRQFIT